MIAVGLYAAEAYKTAMSIFIGIVIGIVGSR